MNDKANQIISQFRKNIGSKLTDTKPAMNQSLLYVLPFSKTSGIWTRTARVFHEGELYRFVLPINQILFVDIGADHVNCTYRIWLLRPQHNETRCIPIDFVYHCLPPCCDLETSGFADREFEKSIAGH